MENFGIVGSVQYDEDPVNPREYDNIGTMVCMHRRYRLGDTQDAPGLLDNHIILLLYLYDHSGLSISTTPFSCPWDSGQVGIIYAEKGVEGLSDEQIRALLKSEVDVYNHYLSGDIYTYIIEDRYGDVIDSCGGYYSEDECTEYMEIALSQAIEEERLRISKLESDFTRNDWKLAVANGDTVLGLGEWREGMYESNNEYNSMQRMEVTQWSVKK